MRVFDNFSTGSRANLAFAGKGRAWRCSASWRASRRCRRRYAVPPWCSTRPPALGAALGGGSTRRQLLQRDGGAASPGGRGEAEEEAARGVRLVLVRVRGAARPSQAGGPAQRRSPPTRPRRSPASSTPRCGPALRGGDGGPALLQRVRAAPGPQERVRGGDPEVHPLGPGGKPLRSTATAPRRATSPTSTMWSRPISSPRGRARAVAGKSYNVGCGSRTSLLEIVALLETMLGRPLARQHEPGGSATCPTPSPT